MSIGAVIFDMDGILIDSEDLWQEAEREIFAEMDIHLGAGDLEQSRGLKSDEMVDHWCNIHRLEGIEQRTLVDRYNEKMVHTLRDHAPLMEGAVQALDFFRAKQVPMALASCSPMEHIRAVLDKHRIGIYFDELVSAAEDDLPGKPHPEIYLKTAALLQVEPARCLAIEDSFFGLISARAARMKVISMPCPAEYDQSRFASADVKIRSLSEINEELYQKLTAL